MVAYASVPVDERMDVLSREADRITGEVARYLQAARHQITASPRR
ncbi:hypothetical protein [Pseudonocardia kujensis]|nr:hypothetical protein [Pseudonocardia kujensis]